MKRIACIGLLLIPLIVFGQNNSVSGNIVDDKNNPASFVNVLVFENEGTTPFKGAVSNDNGFFKIDGLSEQQYRFEISSIGFAKVTLEISIPNDSDLGTIELKPDIEELDEAVVNAKKPRLKKEPGKFTFEVENTILSSGNSLNLLQKTPGVLVLQGQISVKNAPTVIYINDRRVYLSSAEVSTLFTNMDASVIKSVEVITNPSAKYDAEGGAVLNINTSKSVSIGYKGSAGVIYEQAVYAKYNFNTNHFYKNDWLNLFGSYSFSPRKEFKDQDDRIRFFTPFESEKALWISDFNRTTRSYAHQANLIADFSLNEKNTISLAANAQLSPNKTFNNNVFTEMFNPQRALDSTFVTKSNLENNQSNISVNLGHKYKIGQKGAEMHTQLNYIKYDEDQIQEVETDYFLPDGTPSNTNRFNTDANQDTQIYTGELDFSIPAGTNSIQTGVKYSNIDTESALDFFDQISGQMVAELSDNFVYEESIFAAFIETSKTFNKWVIEAGLRGEQTDVKGTSRALGTVNTQSYLELFPSVTIQHKANENDTWSISYARRINRPRYQSLNPFRYFLNENNFNSGNPNLLPGIDNKVTLSLNHKNKWFFDLYYQKTKNTLSSLVFQDNLNQVLRTEEVNLIGDFQYSFDIVYASTITKWWYLSAYTSSFYLENEFFAEESLQETYSNSTYGFFGQFYNALTISKEKDIKGDVTLVYMSNYIFGSYSYKNQFSASASIRKSFWDKRATITLGVDDIFNTNNVNIISRYYNQDNSYFPRPESRLFRCSFKYNFGNARLRDNRRNTKTREEDRLKKN